MRVGERRLWIDLRISNQQQQAFLLEVKSYDTSASAVDFLKQALGQYMLYRAILENIGNTEPLFLAIPINAYYEIFQREIGLLVVDKYAINLVIYNVEDEVIVEWIPKQ